MFNEVRVNRIESFHVPENVNSGKVMIKCGMEYEGLIKQGFKNNKGKLCDIELYGIIANDYFNRLVRQPYYPLVFSKLIIPQIRDILNKCLLRRFRYG